MWKSVFGAAGLGAVNLVRRVGPQIVSWIGWSAVVGTALALLAQFVGSPNRYVTAVQALTPFAIIAVLVVAILWGGLGQQRIGVAAGVVGLVGLVFLWPLLFAPRGPAPDADSPTVSVAGANLLYTNRDIAEALDDIAVHDPDIVGFVEITDRIGDEMDAHPSSANYPYRVSFPGGDPGEGRVVWSKYPITADADDEELKFFITATVDTPGGPLRLVLVHTPAPVFNAAGWRRELARIPSIVEFSETPTVLFGDFNGSYLHPPYRNMVNEAGLVDALPAVGKGFTMTWPMDRWTGPFVALDHVLVTDDIAIVDADAFDVTGSDHRAVIATLARVD